HVTMPSPPRAHPDRHKTKIGAPLRQSRAQRHDRFIYEPAGRLGRDIDKFHCSEIVLCHMMIDDKSLGLERAEVSREITELIPCSRVENNGYVGLSSALVGGREPIDLSFGVEEPVTFRHGAGDNELDLLGLALEGVCQGLHRPEAVAIRTDMRGE